MFGENIDDYLAHIRMEQSKRDIQNAKETLDEAYKLTEILKSEHLTEKEKRRMVKQLHNLL
jgi:hypothetical protein